MSEVTIHVDDELLFRLIAGRRPLVYPDTLTRVSYESGVSVLHGGAVWAIGLHHGVEAFELGDGTIVAAADVDLESCVVNPKEPHQHGAGS